MTITDQPLVSVIIATRDRPQELSQCLAHLFCQTYTPFEVIVVDNSENESLSFMVVRSFQKARYIRVNPKTKNPALMRNCGINKSKGEILAFIDDDSVVMPGWMQALADAFKDKNVGGVTGRVIEDDQTEIETERIGRFSPTGEITMNFNNRIKKKVDVDFLYGCNMAVSRNALQKSGLYDPWFGITYEEQDLSFRIQEATFSLKYIPSMVAYHLKAPRSMNVIQRSTRFNVKSQFITCRSLAFLCVTHFGLRWDFAKVAFLNLPKGAGRVFINKPSLSNLLKIPATLLGAIIGYVMAGLRKLKLHSIPALNRQS